MSPEIVTGVAGAVGYAAGQLMEQLAIDRAAQGHQSLNQVWDLALPNAAPTQLSRLQRLGRRAAAPLAIALGVGAGLSADAWLPTPSPSYSSVPHLELVVDHSGATALPIEGTPVTSEINTVVTQFNNTRHIDAEAIVASGGTTQLMRVNQVSQNQAFGEAQLTDATNQALGRTAEISPVAGQNGVKRDAAILVITNGNTIGQTQQVVQTAEAQHDTPIFVVNVEGAGASATTTESLEAIAHQTGGQYWDANHADLATVSQAVEKTIVATETTDSGDSSNKNILKVLGIVSLIGAEEVFRRRREMPFDRNVRGK